MAFSESVWRDIKPIYQAVQRHPFITGLASGTLPRESFIFYMQQDSLYLQDFSRALALAGVRAPGVRDLQAFLEFANGVAAVERALHETYFREFGVSADVEKAPACFAYTHFLLSTCALGSYAETVGGLLPCFWIYREIGLEIHAKAQTGIATNPYARWIETYAGEQFSRSVDRAIAIADRVHEEASASEREAMRRAFILSSRLEWMFWDSAFRLEAWPPQSGG